MAHRRRKKKHKSKKDRPTAPSKCRDCSAITTVPRSEFFKAARPRCPACGGQLEYGGSWHGVRSPQQ